MPINLDELMARARALGIDLGGLWTTLRPLVLKILIDFLEAQLKRPPVGAGHGHDHPCAATKRAAAALIACAEGDHHAAAHEYLSAAYHCVMHCEGGE